MIEVGKVDGLWRYPVKSMRGEELEEAVVGISEVYGDHLYAFKSSADPASPRTLASQTGRRIRDGTED